VTDAQLSEVIRVQHAANYGVYGARKIWRHLHRIGRWGSSGSCDPAAARSDPRQGEAHHDPGKDGARTGDLVNRSFTAQGPNQPWLADAGRFRLHQRPGLVEVRLRRVRDRRVLPDDRGLEGRHEHAHARVTDTLEMAAWARGRASVTDLTGLIHHSDAGSQYVSLALTARLAALGTRASLGTVADAYDNALAESTTGLFTTELIRRRGPWRTVDDVEIATLEWVDWLNNRRLHTELGDIPPAEHETNHDPQNPAAVTAETREPRFN
jgi:putative transposase